MRAFKIILTILAFVLVAGLFTFGVSRASENIETNEPRMEEEPAKKANIKLIDNGSFVASWYGPKFHGKATATTERFNQMAFTAAHKSLPFGTLLRLTNPENGKSVIVRINDRGPYIEGRDIDLSKGAAIELGILEKGVAKLNVENLVMVRNSI